MVDIRSLISQIPMEPGYVPAPPEPDLSVIQRLMGLPQTLRAVGQNMAVGAASLPVGVYKGFGNPAAGEAAMSQFQQEYGYTPTNPAAQRQLQGLGEFLQQLETEYKIPPMISPSQLPSRAATAGSAMQLGRIGTRMTGQAQDLARDLVREIQTTPPTGAVTMAPSSIPKSDIGFYSQLEAAVQPLQNKGTGQQYLAQIQKSAGVKPEEIQWTGLDEFLKGKKSVTKQEIQDYLNANRVDVQEVRLLGSAPLTEQAFNERFARRGFSMVQTDDGPRFRQTDMTGSRQLTYGELPEDIQATIERQSVPQTKHHLGAYQGIKTEIPGGENYRELLLTLPQKGGVDVKAAEQTRDTLARQTADLMEEWKRLSEEMPGDPRVVELYGRLSETRRARDQAVVDARELRKAAESQTYRSSHFDQPNILAHLRVNDRTVDGKKTLFVEEIQSDWHQAGRKKGYKISTDKWNELSNLYQKELTGPLSQKEIDRIAELEKLGEQTSRESVPDAPFKTSWHELSLKRAIQEAAEKGYDQIAFTTGKTQAERYDLSKQVDNVSYFPSTKTIVAYKGGNSVVEKRVADPKELEEIIGKEAAKKLLNQPTEKIVNARGNEVQSLSGVDLQVGGEGMKGFYDNILPKSLDKLGKKFGAKVGKTFIEGERTRDADGFPSMYPEKIEVWQMDITPQMRESVTTKGQPLFAIPAIGAGLLGAEMMQEEEQF
jgi:hypothetical protein